MEKTKKDESQHKRFIETARALECDEDRERFEEKLKRIAAGRSPSVKKPRARRVKTP